MTLRKILKKMLIKASKHSSILDAFYKNNPYIRMPLGLIFINFITQRVFRINSDSSIPINFTSRVSSFNKIELIKDKSTILSFAISGNCYIQAMNGIKIGKNFLFAPGVKIISANHDFMERDKSVSDKPIIIGNNVWLGANCVILPGVELADGIIIGAGSIVTKSFLEENSIIAGNPAKLLKAY